ncbi:MAG: cytochrome P450, partial [Candidatus Binatus sp.]
MAEAIQFNIWDPEFRANPYPHYAPLLAGPPSVLTFGDMTFALVARYADVTIGLRNHEHLSSVQPPPPPQAYQGRFAGSRNMLGSDPPQHSRLRRLVSRDFTPRRIRELEPRIREIAKDLLDKVAAKSQFDLMSDLANALPVTVIGEMLGVPPELNAKFKHWSDTLIGGDNNAPGAPQPPETIR